MSITSIRLFWLNVRSALTLSSTLVLVLAAGGRAFAGGPNPPTLLAPANGASVQVPFTISWSAVSDSKGIIAYNWQVSSSSSFSPVILQSSTSGQTQDTVSGLAGGTYFWRVQAVNGELLQGSWSQTRSFIVTGSTPGSAGAPTLGPTKGYSTFHPFEVITFNWTAVPGAATYLLQASTDPSFPVLTRIQFDNIPNTTFSFAIGNPEGNYLARVIAVNGSGIASPPSNVISFSVFFNNPLPPPPTPLSPANGATLTLPVTLTWTDVPNPQPSGYELQIAKDSAFSTIEDLAPQLNNPTRTVLSLTSGTKFWRVRSMQGNSSLTTAAVTAWSTTGTFTISSAPPTPVSISLATNPLFSGDSSMVFLQLSGAAPPGGAAIALTSSNSTAAPVPSTVTMQGNIAWMQFMIQAGQVISPTPVTLTATLNAGAAAVQFNVLPPSLKSIFTPSTISGGALAGVIVMLNGQAPAGGAVVSLSSSSPAASPPSTVTVPPGSFSASATMPTSPVTTTTTATITATWNGVSAQSQITLTPVPPPATLTLNPTTVTGTGGSFATVTIAAPQTTDVIFPITSSNPAVARINNSVMIPAGVMAGGFDIFTTLVTQQTLVTISVSGGGVTKSATLTVDPLGAPPPPPPAVSLSTFTLSPTSVTGGNPSTGTVTLTSAAPTGGVVVSLSSQLPGSASVPPSVTVPAGATSATFTVTSFPVAATTVQIAATLGNVTLFAPLSVNVSAPPPPPPPPPPGTLAAPTLLAPASGARFSPGQLVSFDWSDVTGAASYTIQVSTSSSFTTTAVNTVVTPSQFSTSSLPKADYFWRARANSSGGTAGTWSTVRSFRVN